MEKNSYKKKIKNYIYLTVGHFNYNFYNSCNNINKLYLYASKMEKNV